MNKTLRGTPVSSVRKPQEMRCLQHTNKGMVQVEAGDMGVWRRQAMK